MDFAHLADWVEGRLSGEEAVAVEEWLAVADEKTLADLAWLRTFAKVSQEVILLAPPAWVRESSTNRFEAYARSKRNRAPGSRKRFLARLISDSGLQQATAGVRTAGASELGRQLVYGTDVLDIALDILPHDENRLELEGQVFPNGEDAAPDSFAVRLVQGETEFGTTVTDDFGEFAFEAIPPGVYEMLLSTDHYDIMVAAPIALEA